MQQPKGFEYPNFPHHICELRKSIYGMKQTPCACFERFSNYLEDLGFTASQGYHSLFVYQNNGVLLILLVYVDDILITDNNNIRLSQHILSLNKIFAMKDLRCLHYFLGLEATFTEGLDLTRTKYDVDLLKHLKMEPAKPYTTPAITG